MKLDLLRRVLAGKKVMIVEDSTFLGVIIEEMLEEAGCLVLGPFRRIDHASRALASAEPDAAILDIRVGNALTFDLAESLRKRQIPLLMISGYFSHAVPQGLRSGFLQKPFDESTLLSALAGVMDTQTCAASRLPTVRTSPSTLPEEPFPEERGPFPLR